jgi:hypothetical protein
MTIRFVVKATFAVYPSPQRDNFPQRLELVLAPQGVIAQIVVVLKALRLVNLSSLTSLALQGGVVD